MCIRILQNDRIVHPIFNGEEYYWGKRLSVVWRFDCSIQFHFCLVLLQIWDWDYDKGAQVLLIDADRMVLVNDPILVEYVQQLDGTYYGGRRGGRTAKEKKTSFFKDVAEVGAAVILKILEVAIEILAA